ncbi:unnamed protein product, partial [Tilletia caries]
MWLRADQAQIFTDETVRLRDKRLVRPLNFFRAAAASEGVLSEGRLVYARDDSLPLELLDSVLTFDPVDIDVNFSDALRQRQIVDRDGKELPSVNPLRTMAKGRLIFQVPVILFVDETSGTTTKRWNEHVAVYMSNAGLERKDMDSPSNIKLLSVSTNVGAEDLLSVFADELVQLQEQPFSVFDAWLETEVLVRPHLFCCVADNPMAATLCGSIGMRGLFACRRCRVGGTKKVMKTQRGFKKLLELGEVKTAKQVIASLKSQLSLAEKKGVTSRLVEKQRATGIKDAITNRYCEQLINSFKALSKAVRVEAVKAVKREKDEILSKRWHHCLLSLHDKHGFDVCEGTPVDLLHTYQLGLVKYVWTQMLFKATEAQKIEIGARLSAAPLSGIADFKALRGPWLVSNSGGLAGKDLKYIAQVAANAFYPMMQDGTMDLGMWAAWSAVGILGRLLFIENVARKDLETYKDNLLSAIMAFYSSAAASFPSQVAAKPKYNIMLHMIENIDQFGPPKGFSAERYEAFNAVIRKASICSNRSAPSKDILQRVQDQELIRHVVSAGCWMKGGEVRKPSPLLHQLPSDALKAEFSILDPPSISSQTSVKFLLSAQGDRIGVGAFATINHDVSSEKRSIVRMDELRRLEDGTMMTTVTHMNCDVDASGLEPIVLKVGRQQSGTFVGSMFDRLLNVSHDCHHHGCKVDIAGAAVR